MPQSQAVPARRGYPHPSILEFHHRSFSRSGLNIFMVAADAFPRRLLHDLCAGLSAPSSAPPSLRGLTWSAVNAIGWLAGRAVLMRLPHSQHGRFSRATRRLSAWARRRYSRLSLPARSGTADHLVLALTTRPRRPWWDAGAGWVQVYHCENCCNSPRAGQASSWGLGRGPGRHPALRASRTRARVSVRQTSTPRGVSLRGRVRTLPEWTHPRRVEALRPGTCSRAAA